MSDVLVPLRGSEQRYDLLNESCFENSSFSKRGNLHVVETWCYRLYMRLDYFVSSHIILFLVCWPPASIIFCDIGFSDHFSSQSDEQSCKAENYRGTVDGEDTGTKFYDDYDIDKVIF